MSEKPTNQAPCRIDTGLFLTRSGSKPAGHIPLTCIHRHRHHPCHLFFSASSEAPFGHAHVLDGLKLLRFFYANCFTRIELLDFLFESLRQCIEHVPELNGSDWCYTSLYPAFWGHSPLSISLFFFFILFFSLHLTLQG